MADDVVDKKRRDQEKGGAKSVREVESRDLSPVGGGEEEFSSVGRRDSDSSPSPSGEHRSPTPAPPRRRL